MGSLSTSDDDLILRLRRLGAVKRRKLLQQAEAQEAADAARGEERLRKFRAAAQLWPLSAEETQNLIDEIYAAREIEE